MSETYDIPKISETISRRTFLKAAAGTATAAAFPLFFTKSARGAGQQSTPDRPNILFIIVDQQRAPRWFPSQDILNAFLPNQARIHQGAVNFTGHYAAATKCSPSRGNLLTGLYSHQTGFVENQRKTMPALNVGFPTWGTALRDAGYSTNWYGKWHLSYDDTLEPYGFDGGTFPSPNGGIQEGTDRDGKSVDQFIEWFDRSADRGPWATTVSLLNPHDICSHPHATHAFFQNNPYPNVIKSLPGNYETPEDIVRYKPRLQAAYQGAADTTLGSPSSEAERQAAWIDVLNAYLAYQGIVDYEIGRVLDELDKRPDIRDNTVIIFTSDHGEFGSSHGLRGKGGSIYEEGIHVPLYVKDPTNRLTANSDVPRNQLTSFVDLYGLFLTIATGSNSWRADPNYAHLANRVDLAAILKNPNAPGRSYILHTSDQPYLEAAAELAKAPIPVPYHLIGYRSNTGKIGIYNEWKPNSHDLVTENQDVELYDYSTNTGRLEIGNDSKTKPVLLAKLTDELYNNAIPNELREQLPPKLEAVKQQAFDDYYTYRLTAPTSLTTEL